MLASAIMSPLKLLALFGALAVAAVLPRDKDVPAGQCCFELHDVATGKAVQQDKQTGYLYFETSKPTGWYCIDLSNSHNVLRDDFNNACFLSTTAQFKCLDPTIGPNSWTLESDDQAVQLAHDGDSAYYACPSPTGGELLWGDLKADVSGCRATRIKAEGLTGTCKGLTA